MLLAVALVARPTRAYSQTVAPERVMIARLDTLFGRMEAHDRVMGSVTVRRGNRVLYQRSLGHRDSTARGWQRADRATAYRVGSLTKPFTAALVYQLIDAGRLSLDTPLARFFPAIPGSDSITVRDLLGHTSGLGDYTAGLDFLVPLSRESVQQRIAAGARQFAPGTARRYNNSNYWLLGEITVAVTRSSLDAQLQRRIARPLRLTRTRFGGAVSARRNEARSYLYADSGWALQPDHAIEHAAGAGAMISTTDDLTKFLAALFAGRVISKSSLNEMIAGFVDATRRNGKGLSPFTIPGTTKTGYSHDGSIGAFTSLMGYVPADSIGIALTLNGHNYPQNQLFFKVWDIVYGTAAPIPNFIMVALPDSLAAQVVGTYAASGAGLTITVRLTSNGLVAQAAGQEPFALDYIAQRRFMQKRHGILIDFADAVDGRAPRFVLYQQRSAITLARAETP